MSDGENPFATPREFRDPARRLRGRLASPVTLWTSGAGDARAGLTVSSIVVAEGEPPVVVGLINTLTDLFDAVQETGAFVVHVLARHQRRLAERFAGVFPSPGGHFAEKEWEQSKWGPVLTAVADRACCRLAGIEEVGYHTLLRGAVERVDVGQALDPLVYLRGGFRGLEPTERP